MIIDEIIEKDIERLEELLDNIEDTDPAYLSEHIRLLRHKDFYIQFKLEKSIEILIAQKTYEHIKDKITTQDKQDIYTKMLKLMEKQAFSRKLETAKSLEIFEGTSSYKLTKDVNELR